MRTIIDKLVELRTADKDLGCALRNWLVVTGAQAGIDWRDMRAGSQGIAPLKNANGSPLTFTDWYRNWLDSSLDKVRTVET